MQNIKTQNLLNKNEDFPLLNSSIFIRWELFYSLTRYTNKFGKPYFAAESIVLKNGKHFLLMGDTASEAMAKLFTQLIGEE